jgi:ACDE family multidrug resistance protein
MSENTTNAATTKGSKKATSSANSASASPLILLSLSLVPFIMVLGNSMLIPVLPKIQSSLNITPFQVSMLITMFSIPAGLTIPLAGVLSDQVGRKKVVIPALCIYAAGGLVAGLSPMLNVGTYPLLLAGRVIQGIGAAGTAPIAMALAGDIFVKQQRSKVLGIMEAANGLGKVVSPILGALVGLIAWYATFWLFPLLCIPAALAVWFFIEEPKDKKTNQSLSAYFSSLKKIFKKKSNLLLPSFFAGLVVLFSLFGLLFYLSELLEKTHKIDGVIKGFYLAIPVLAMAAASYGTGIYIKKRSKQVKIIVVGGLVFTGLGLLAMAFFTNLYYYLGATALVGIGTGPVLACLNTIVTGSVASDERGLVTALYGSVRFIGVALGPPFFSVLMKSPKLITFGIVAIIAGLAAVLFYVFAKTNSANQGTTEQAKVAKG